MIVKLRSSGEVSVVDVENLRELKVVTEAGVALSTAETQLAGLGYFRDGHVWLDVEALRDAALPSAESSDWESGFQKMIAYASSKGWTDDAATSVRAHVEPETEGDGSRKRAEPATPDSSSQ